jgi:ADP-heptose:LPS heptosyltransferase
MSQSSRTILVHLGAGVGNIVLATPLLVALHELGFTVDVLLAADYAETADLLRPWSVVRKILHGLANAQQLAGYAKVLPAIPPFYWPRFARRFTGIANLVPRPRDSLFFENEQEFYLSFARVLGYPAGRKPFYTLPIAPDDSFGVTLRTVVLAPGCKTGAMAAKRWPYFPQLAQEFEDVAVVGTVDDLPQDRGGRLPFPAHARSFVDRLTLRQTAELMAGAGLVVGNDSGLSHVAAACGTPCIMIFGPTPHQVLGQLPPHVTVVRRGLTCEPCWYQSRLQACARQVDCLRELTVQLVAQFASEKTLKTLAKSNVATESKSAFVDFESGAFNHSATLPAGKDINKPSRPGGQL